MASSAWSGLESQVLGTRRPLLLSSWALQAPPDIPAHPRGAYSVPSRDVSPLRTGLCSHLLGAMAGITSLRTILAQTSIDLKVLERISQLFCSTHEEKTKNRKCIAGMGAVNCYAAPPAALGGKGGWETSFHLRVSKSWARGGPRGQQEGTLHCRSSTFLGRRH